MSGKRKSNVEPQAGKKAKTGFEDYSQASSFEEDLMLMDSLTEESQTQSQDSLSQSSDCQINDSTDKKNHWIRPPLAPIDSSKDTVIFQQMEVDYYTGLKIVLKLIFFFFIV